MARYIVTTPTEMPLLSVCFCLEILFAMCFLVDACSLPQTAYSLPQTACALPQTACSLPSTACSLPLTSCSLPPTA